MLLLSISVEHDTDSAPQMPRNVQLTVDRYLVDRAQPGTRVTVIGVYTIPTGRGKDKSSKADLRCGTHALHVRFDIGIHIRTFRTPYLRVVGLQLNKGGPGRWHSLFTPAEEDEFVRLARRENIRDLIANSIAPAILGLDNEKVQCVRWLHSRALLTRTRLLQRMVACLLFGGTRKFLPDGMRLRGDINVLLLGDPGTGKSQLLKVRRGAA